MPSEHILSVNDLRLELHPPSLSQPPRQILDGVTFDLARGSSLAILGRTASGKSLLLRAITRFFHELPVRSVEGEIWFEGKNLLRTSNQKLLNIRGARIAYILQNAHQNFNARLSIRQHFDILLRFNRPKIKDRAAHAIFYLYKVGILDPEALIEKRCFPVELDIETRQLVMIASALACEPRLLIMDEPAAEFDSNTVAHLVDMLEDLKLERGMSVLMGTGRVRRAEQFADLIAVLEKGELVEIATPRQLFESGREDATRAFVDGTLLAGHERERLVAHYYHSRSDQSGMQVYPKLVVFDLDFTLWDCGGKWIDCTDWPFRQEQDRVFDQSGNEFLLYAEVRELLDELQDADCRLALASRTTRPEWADWLLKAWDLDSCFAHQEIYPSSKIRHFEKLQADTNISFEEMIFFDDEERNIIEVAALGVTAVHVRNGLDRATFEEGLERHGS